MAEKNFANSGFPKAAVDSARILRSLSNVEGFHFFLPNNTYTGETATSLLNFSRVLLKIDIESIRYHFDRKDFQSWIRTTLGDEELAMRLDRVNSRISGEDLRNQLFLLIQERLTELQHLKQ